MESVEILKELLAFTSEKASGHPKVSNLGHDKPRAWPNPGFAPNQGSFVSRDLGAELLEPISGNRHPSISTWCASQKLSLGLFGCNLCHASFEGIGV